ncbi:hypothetical protein [Actinomadura roseirufa]|uniref:hypothetical protein n=1 Tax=Actinomadura roseirufa TaxID=2094049 RepID=UPI001041481D|nr:hypothetical protein [Actinomadura roseirufa]
MSQAIPHTFTYAELERLDPDVLPRRLALSGMTAQSASGGHDDTSVYYACQSTYSGGTSGLLGLGLLAEPPRSSLTCVPAVVAHKSA